MEIKRKRRTAIALAILTFIIAYLGSFPNKLEVRGAMEYADTSNSFSDNSSNIVIQPRMMCPYCSNYTLMYCLKNRRYSYSYPHTPECTVDVYRSNAVDGCLSCGHWNQYYGEHDCREVHSTCSKGYDDVCIIGKYWPQS